MGAFDVELVVPSLLVVSEVVVASEMVDVGSEVDDVSVVASDRSRLANACVSILH